MFSSRYTYSTEFSDVSPEAERTSPWIPKFVYILLDQTGLAPKAVTGGIRAGSHSCCS